MYDPAQYPFLIADAFTFDSMVLGPKTHVIIYKGRDYTGGTWIDIHGPVAMQDSLFLPEGGCPVGGSAPIGNRQTLGCATSYTYWAEFSAPWPNATDYPLSTRVASPTSMQPWGRGSSVQVSCDP